MNKVYVAGVSLPKDSDAASCVVLYPGTDGRYAVERLSAKKCSGGDTLLEVRGVTKALNLIPAGRNLRVESLNESLVGLVQHKGERGWPDNQHFDGQLRLQLQQAISRHTSVSGVLRHPHMHYPSALKLIREDAMKMLDMNQADQDQSVDKYDHIRSEMRRMGAFACETGELVQRDIP